MATIKKACKGTLYPKSSSVSSRLGSVKKAAKGGSFPDLNKDGKVTKKDILIGKGVLPKTAKKGGKIKKAQSGMKMKSDTMPSMEAIKGTYKNYLEKKQKSSSPSYEMTNPSSSSKPKYETKNPSASAKPKYTPLKKGGSVKKTMKKGGKMTKKCAYGCK